MKECVVEHRSFGFLIDNLQMLNESKFGLLGILKMIWIINVDLIILKIPVNQILHKNIKPSLSLSPRDTVYLDNRFKWENVITAKPKGLKGLAHLVTDNFNQKLEKYSCNFLIIAQKIMHIIRVV